MRIDRYETAYENGRVHFYAVAGKKRIEMPECYKEMYTDDYLEIEERTLERPELFDAPATHYVPLRTAFQ